MDRESWLASESLEPFPLREAGNVLCLAAALPAFRWVCEKLVFMPIGRALMMPRGKAGDRKSALVPDKMASRVLKFSESQWKLLCFSTFTVVGIAATFNQPWLWNTRECWTSWPQQQMTPAMRLLYTLETAYYLSTIAMLALWEVPRKDFHVMMAHHFVTVVSIIFTYKYNYTRIGCVVMLLHDVNDVLMEVAKSCNYLKLDTLATAVFSVFVVSWAALRIYAFPMHCIYSSYFESWQVLGFRPPFHGLLNVLLSSLFCIHVYWFSLILRIVWQKLSTGQARDIREDVDEE